MRTKILVALATLVCVVAMWRAYIGFEEGPKMKTTKGTTKATTNATTRVKQSHVKEPKVEIPREPSAVDEQMSFLSELLTMTKAVDALSGDERKRKTEEFEEKLTGMEAYLATQPDSPFKTKNLNIISLIRHGLNKDQLGETLDAPNEELLQNFGIEKIKDTHYWDDAFAKNRFGELFEWYLDPEGITATEKSLKELMTENIGDKTHSILHLGSGNSVLSHHLYESGFEDIINLDASPTVTRKMEGKFKEKYPSMRWETMDAEKMSYDDGKFDVLLEKGLLDTLFPNHADGFSEMLRVMKPTGKVISVTFNGDELEKKFSEEGLPCVKQKLGEQKEDPMKQKANPEIKNEKGSKVFHLLVCQKSSES